MLAILLLVATGWHPAFASMAPTGTNSIVSAVFPQPSYADYAPLRVQCPANQTWLRSSASGMSVEEKTWVQGRKAKVADSLRDYLAALSLEEFDVEEYFDLLRCRVDRVPTIGMAISGGGWASSLTATGALRAFDARHEPSVKHRTGGILQSMTYLSGLSGGSWPPISLALNNFPTIDDMVSSWVVELNRIVPPQLSDHTGNLSTYVQDMIPKFQAGFNVSFMEALGRSFAFEFVPGPNGGMGASISNIPFLSAFANHEMPFPMFQSAAGTPYDPRFFDIEVPNDNTTIFEFNPFEFGSWNGPSQFFPMRYLGTTMDKGKPIGDCVTGFDRASFLLAAAADAANFWIIENDSNGTLGDFSKRDCSDLRRPSGPVQRRQSTFPNQFPPAILSFLQDSFARVFNYSLIEALFVSLPNPFYNSSESSTPQEMNRDNTRNLTLIDESEAFQSLPLWTQIQPARRPDFLIAWDNDGGDTLPYNWNNGTNLYGSYLYANNYSIPFPVIPPPPTFINRNFTHRPVFFGCNADLTTTNDTQAPIILYLTNSPYSSYTNYSWAAGNYSDEAMQVIMTNSFNIVTQGNGTLDAEWPECLGCAVIDRSLERVDLARTEQCERCFARYCWDGVEENEDPSILDLPTLLDPKWSYADWNLSATKDFWPELPQIADLD